MVIFLPQIDLVHTKLIEPTPPTKKENDMPFYFIFAIEPNLVKILTKLENPNFIKILTKSGKKLNKNDNIS